MEPNTPKNTPPRTVAPTRPAAKRPQPAPNDKKPSGPVADEGWEKARPKDTGRGGA